MEERLLSFVQKVKYLLYQSYLVIYCNYTVKNNKFYGNSAQYNGGVIYYNKYRPDGLLDNQYFPDNRAQYGDDYASFPLSLQVEMINQQEAASGQRYQGKIIVRVVDPEGQLVSNDNSTSIMIEAIDDSQAGVTGLRQLKVENGIAIYDDLKFYAQPGTKGVKFVIFSTTINDQYRRESLNIPNDIITNKEVISIDFRICLEGESSTNNECLVCEAGSYSLKQNSSQCQQCPQFADCPGGYQIVVFSGYWRKDQNSSEIYKCLAKEACVGGTYPQNYSKSKDYFPLCIFFLNYALIGAYGYCGNLCDRCINNNQIHYSREGVSKCAQCPDKVVNMLLLQGIFLAIMLYLLFLIRTNLKENANHETSAIMRILTNFLQILTSTNMIDLQWPESLTNFYKIFSQLGESSDRLLSFDCFLQNTLLANESNSFVYIKALMMSVMPLLIIFIYFLIMLIAVVNKGLGKKALARWIIATSVVTIYFLHPQVTKYVLGLFFCQKIHDKFYLQQDMQVECWTDDHMKNLLLIGVPFMLLWVILAPIVGFLILKRNKSKLLETEFKVRFQALYLGLNPQNYYWEFVNVFRKTFMVAINIFLQTQIDFFKALVTLMVLCIMYRIQIRNQPYKNQLINILEQREIQCSIVTFFGSLFFVSNELDNLGKRIVFIVIIVFVIWFMILWLYCFLYTQQYWILRKIAKYLRYLTLLPLQEEERTNIDIINQGYQVTDLGFDIIKEQDTMNDSYMSPKQWNLGFNKQYKMRKRKPIFKHSQSFNAQKSKNLIEIFKNDDKDIIQHKNTMNVESTVIKLSVVKSGNMSDYWSGLKLHDISNDTCKIDPDLNMLDTPLASRSINGVGFNLSQNQSIKLGQVLLSPNTRNNQRSILKKYTDKDTTDQILTQQYLSGKYNPKELFNGKKQRNYIGVAQSVNNKVNRRNLNNLDGKDEAQKALLQLSQVFSPKISQFSQGGTTRRENMMQLQNLSQRGILNQSLVSSKFEILPQTQEQIIFYPKKIEKPRSQFARMQNKNIQLVIMKLKDFDLSLGQQIKKFQ
ncbi:UNKNOWN [Stylonychia lemnae]|uniref:Transmembrane protein n=1 Tax=Stylonychia lemnae TaxID=5949 RepID=A0A078B5H7_STYLE|nr:UNKNOWN [Stylonychia lemnae]|eukprot:CDW88778.1 UNKNOWN [Stylonychia lemnae]